MFRRNRLIPEVKSIPNHDNLSGMFYIFFSVCFMSRIQIVLFAPSQVTEVKHLKWDLVIVENVLLSTALNEHLDSLFLQGQE